MPSFTSQVPNLQAVGPIVELRVAVGSAVEGVLRKAGNPVPTPVPAVAMIDTGATGTVIRQGLASSDLVRLVLPTLTPHPRLTWPVTSTL